MHRETGRRAGTIRIAASRSDGVLTLSVCNDGPSLPSAGDGLARGLGCRMCGLACQSLYGDAFELSMRQSGGGWGGWFRFRCRFAVAVAGGAGLSVSGSGSDITRAGGGR